MLVLKNIWLKIVGVATVVVLAVAVVCVSGCGMGRDTLVGTWQQDSDGERVVVIEDDGTYVYYRFGLDKKEKSYPGTWADAENGYYTFTASASGVASTGYIDEDENLTITMDGGKVDTVGAYTFIKQP